MKELHKFVLTPYSIANKTKEHFKGVFDTNPPKSITHKPSIEFKCKLYVEALNAMFTVDKKARRIMTVDMPHFDMCMNVMEDSNGRLIMDINTIERDDKQNMYVAKAYVNSNIIQMAAL